LPPIAILSLISNPLGALVVLGGMVATVSSAAALWLAYRRRFLAQAAMVAGVAGVLYFVSFFAQGNPPPAQVGFWLAVVASVGLVAQGLSLRSLPVTTPAAPATPTSVAPRPARIKPTSGLDLGQNLEVAIDALAANKMRSALTMLGVVIGVMSVVALLSIGRGAQASITDQISGTGLNLLTVLPRTTGSSRNLTFDDAQALLEVLTGVNAVMPQYGETLRVRSDNDNILTSVQGVIASYAEFSNLTVDAGRFLTEQDIINATRVVVLGKKAANDLFGSIDPLGKTVRINGVRFTVVGVLGQQDSGFGADPNMTIFTPLETAYRNLFSAKATGSNSNLVSSIRISVTDLDDVTAVKAQAEYELRKRHRIDPGDDNDFNLQDQQSLLNTANQITSVLTILLGAIASVSLLVGGIGIMNISLVSVTERTKEIGLRKALGARKARILGQFLIETMLLSTLGGLIGVLLGVGTALLVNATGLINAVITWDAILLGLGFSILVGVFFGVYPAQRAAALQPIEALRYE
jgi:putative ABC transport system permease protein